MENLSTISGIISHPRPSTTTQVKAFPRTRRHQARNCRSCAIMQFLIDAARLSENTFARRARRDPVVRYPPLSPDEFKACRHQEAVCLWRMVLWYNSRYLEPKPQYTSVRGQGTPEGGAPGSAVCVLRTFPTWFAGPDRGCKRIPPRARHPSPFVGANGPSQ